MNEGSQYREVEIIPDAPGTLNADVIRTPERDPNQTPMPESLFPPSEAGMFQTRWEEIQSGFVDDPRRSVEKADQLVADTIKRLSDVFAEQRNNLERDWVKGDGTSTEDLRQAFRRYRTFFERLLSARGEPVAVRG